jgi:hypothetical protein
MISLFNRFICSEKICMQVFDRGHLQALKVHDLKPLCLRKSSFRGSFMIPVTMLIM